MAVPRASANTSTEFEVGTDRFEDLQINPTSIENFHYFRNKNSTRPIKRFVLDRKQRVKYVCDVTLIQSGEKFTPRLHFSVRDSAGRIVTSQLEEKAAKGVKGSINFAGCHENFWNLISFLQSLRDIDIPRSSFSMLGRGEAEILAAFKGRDRQSVIDIFKRVSSESGLRLSHEDINQLLMRREKLAEFEDGLRKDSPESWWQDFFDQNKWIFGYGLNYQILRAEQSQPHYGGTRVDGGGGQKGDYLTSTLGEVGFTVLVEIKTPSTPMLQGAAEIRNGAWSLSKSLTDALAQIQANIAAWDKRGSEQPENRDRFERSGVYTVQPKGIIVIGHLEQVKNVRSKLETLQRFRKSIHGVEVIAFDELFTRAKFIVESSSNP